MILTINIQNFFHDSGAYFTFVWYCERISIILIFARVKRTSWVTITIEPVFKTLSLAVQNNHFCNRFSSDSHKFFSGPQKCLRRVNQDRPQPESGQQQRQRQMQNALNTFLHHPQGRQIKRGGLKIKKIKILISFH